MLGYLKKLIRSNSQESSKRFMAMYCVLILVTYVIIRYANEENIEIVLVELLGFVSALMGLASWQNVQKRKQQ